MEEQFKQQDKRLTQVEVNLGKIVSSVEALAETVGTVAEKTDRLTGHISSLEASQAQLAAGQGKIPVGTIFGTVMMILGLFSLILTLVVVPMRSEISENATSQRTLIEEHMPELSADMADIQARVTENETELGHLWSDPSVGAFAALRERAEHSVRFELMSAIIREGKDDLDELREQLDAE